MCTVLRSFSDCSTIVKLLRNGNSYDRYMYINKHGLTVVQDWLPHAKVLGNDILYRNVHVYMDIKCKLLF